MHLTHGASDGENSGCDLNRLSARSWLLALYVLTVIVVVLIERRTRIAGPDNNFLIFRWSFVNLHAGSDMYAAQPQHHTDLYKYSPSFAVLFAPFALLPFTLALVAWDALNALLLFFAVDRLLPGRQAAHRARADLSRGGAHDAALAEQCARDGARDPRVHRARAAATARRRVRDRDRRGGEDLSARGARARALSSATPSLRADDGASRRVVVLALPLLVTTPAGLAAQYQSWRAVESVDAISVGGGGGGGLYGGVMQQLRFIFGVSWPNWPVQLAGTLLLMLPAVRWRNWAVPISGCASCARSSCTW